MIIQRSSIARVINFIFVIIIFTLTWKSFWTMLNICAPIIAIKPTVLFILSGILLILSCFFYPENKFIVNKKKLIFSLLILLLAFVCFAFNEITNVANLNTSLSDDVNTYGWFILLILVIIFNLEMDEKLFEKTTLFILLPQLFLGIIQHFKNSPIVPISLNGSPIVTTVFTLNGLSTSDPGALAQGASVRGFGMTINALTLGIMALVIFSLALNSKILTGRIRLFVGIVSLVAIFSTMTRNIYIGAILILFFSLKKFSKTFYKITFLLVNIFSLLGIYAAKLLAFINQFVLSKGITTFSIRYSSLFYHLSELNSILKILFGAQIKSTPEFPLDNGPVAILVDKGLLFTILTIGLIIVVYNYCIDNMNDQTRPLLICIFVFQIMNFANALTDVSGMLLIFLLMVSLNNNMILENKDGELSN